MIGSTDISYCEGADGIKICNKCRRYLKNKINRNDVVAIIQPYGIRTFNSNKEVCSYFWEID